MLPCSRKGSERSGEAKPVKSIQIGEKTLERHQTKEWEKNEGRRYLIIKLNMVPPWQQDTLAPGLELLVPRSPRAELSILLSPEFVRDRCHTQAGDTNGFLWMDTNG